MAKRRRFTAQFKAEVVLEALTGSSSQAELCRRHHLSDDQLSKLKEEEVHLNDYEDSIEAKQRIGHFITQVYNQKRPHAALGYLTPSEFEQKHLS